MIEIRSMNFNVALRDESCLTVEGELFFLEVLKEIEHSNLLQIWDIEHNKLVCQGITKQIEIQSSKVDEYEVQIRTLKMLKSMQDKYNVKFTLPESTQYDEDREQLLHLLFMVGESEIVQSICAELIVSLTDKQTIINMVGIVENNKESIISFDVTQTVSGCLFGVEIEFLLEEKFDGVMIEDVNLIKSKLEFFEDGELMKISFTPHKEAQVYKRVKIVSMY